MTTIDLGDRVILLVLSHSSLCCIVAPVACSVFLADPLWQKCQRTPSGFGKNFRPLAGPQNGLKMAQNWSKFAKFSHISPVHKHFWKILGCFAARRAKILDFDPFRGHFLHVKLVPLDQDVLAFLPKDLRAFWQNPN